MSHIRKEPVGFLVYKNGDLLTPHTVSGSIVRKMESEESNLEVFGVHPLVARNTGKLTAEDVREIRASGETQTVLARRFGVVQSQISLIKRFKAWKHLTM